MSKIKLHWLTERNAARTSVNFGTPWAKGVLMPGESIALLDEAERNIPVQTKINAYWPDGSVKWLLHSAVLDSNKSFVIEKGKGAKGNSRIQVSQAEDGSVKVESDLIICTLQLGEKLISSLIRKNTRQESASACLAAFIENRDLRGNVENVTIHKFTGVTKKIHVEENGPLRAVVKVEGYHEDVNQKLQIFPFVIRLYFYSGSDEIKIIHSFIFNADENKDFLKGIAIQFHLPVRGELWNRHVGFAGDTGMFYEAVQPLYYDRGIHPFYEQQQIHGQFVTFGTEEKSDFYCKIRDNATWGNFRLQQNACDHYAIIKSTKKECAYIPAAQGNRSQGAVFFGNESIIFSVAVKDFWQKSPMALEITGATGENANVSIWLWSKYAEAFDFRAYDTVIHKHSYGGIDNQPEGIANTNEIFVKLFEEMPGKKAIQEFAEDVQTDSLLIADPEVYEETKVFGTYWCPPKKDSYRTAAYEKAFIEFIHYYINEVEQRKWYGFWDYGDVMHTYDEVRHCWRYDVGGYAWHNTELCNTYVNWIAFLRSGNYAIYRFARAMARHSSEVDTYHSGDYAMLGSRHNVRHWGCGAKEPRISMAGHHRFFYYLTGDERIGDIIDFVKDADYTVLFRDPMHDYFNKETGYAHIRTGPDWSSFVSNWMTQWERYNDTLYRDKILVGLNSIKQAPNRLASGSTFLYNPKDNLMRYIGEGNYQYHMVICFGGPEIWFELADLIEDDELKDMLAQFGDYYAMTPEKRKEMSKGLFNESNDKAWNGLRFAIRMVAYAGYWYQNPERMRQALEMLAAEPDNSSNTPGCTDKEGNVIYTDVADTEYVRKIREVMYANTNGITQWSLNYIETAKLREMMEADSCI